MARLVSRLLIMVGFLGLVAPVGLYVLWGALFASPYNDTWPGMGMTRLGNILVELLPGVAAASWIILALRGAASERLYEAGVVALRVIGVPFLLFSASIFVVVATTIPVSFFQGQTISRLNSALEVLGERDFLVSLTIATAAFIVGGKLTFLPTATGWIQRAAAAAAGMTLATWTMVCCPDRPAHFLWSLAVLLGGGVGFMAVAVFDAIAAALRTGPPRLALAM